MTQTEKVMNYMKQHGSITPLDALREFGCMRLAARINELEQRGINIQHETESSTNRDGQKVSFARYRLV